MKLVRQRFVGKVDVFKGEQKWPCRFTSLIPLISHVRFAQVFHLYPPSQWFVGFGLEGSVESAGVYLESHPQKNLEHHLFFAVLSRKPEGLSQPWSKRMG